jgi:hypothetical protein
VITRFEFPEHPKTLPMPTKEGVGFENEQRISPVLHATGEEDEPKAIRSRKGRLFNLAVQDNELLAKKYVLSYEVSFATSQVGDSAEDNRIARRLGEIQKGLFKSRNQTDNQLDEQM